ncbi:MAG: UspA domain protein [Candidatus Solibacter sp.]|jgi:nucleotide-binding universal stress UspA family protein|nr:UspA domain protein [Candidatus Solibacter sp.]
MHSLKKILLPVDFSERCAAAVRYVRELALRFDAELILAHVLPPLHAEFGLQIEGSMLVEVYRARAEQAERELAAFETQSLLDLRVRRLILHGDPAAKIVECAQSEGADLIAMPTHGYGPFRRFILGSNTAKVLHDSDCPVWTGVHVEEIPAFAHPFRRILCAVDLGPQSERALAWASWLQQEFRGHLTLIHAIAAHSEILSEPDLSWRANILEIAEEELLRLQREVGVEADLLLQAGEPVRVICSAAARVNAGTVVIGRGSASGDFGRLRTNAYSIIRQSPCPVVSV